jgi:hypothetical protein
MINMESSSTTEKPSDLINETIKNLEKIIEYKDMVRDL